MSKNIVERLEKNRHQFRKLSKMNNLKNGQKLNKKLGKTVTDKGIKNRIIIIPKTTKILKFFYNKIIKKYQ